MLSDSHFKSNTISVPTLNLNWFFLLIGNVSFLVKGDLSVNLFMMVIFYYMTAFGWWWLWALALAVLYSIGRSVDGVDAKNTLAVSSMPRIESVVSTSLVSFATSSKLRSTVEGRRRFPRPQEHMFVFTVPSNTRAATKAIKTFSVP